MNGVNFLIILFTGHFAFATSATTIPTQTCLGSRQKTINDLQDIINTYSCSFQEDLKSCEDFSAGTFIAGAAAGGAIVRRLAIVPDDGLSCKIAKNWISFFPEAVAAKVCELNAKQLANYYEKLFAATSEEMKATLQRTPTGRDHALTMARNSAARMSLQELDAELNAKESEIFQKARKQFENGSRNYDEVTRLTRESLKTNRQYQQIAQLRTQMSEANNKLSLGWDNVDKDVDQMFGPESRSENFLPKARVKDQFTINPRSATNYDSYGIDYRLPTSNVGSGETLASKLDSVLPGRANAIFSNNMAREMDGLDDILEHIDQNARIPDQTITRSLSSQAAQGGHAQLYDQSANHAKTRWEMEEMYRNFESQREEFFKAARDIGPEDYDKLAEPLDEMVDIYDNKLTTTFSRLNLTQLNRLDGAIGAIADNVDVAKKTAQRMGKVASEKMARFLATTAGKKLALWGGLASTGVGAVASAADIADTIWTARSIKRSIMLDTTGTCIKKEPEPCQRWMEGLFHQDCSTLAGYSQNVHEFMTLSNDEKMKVLNQCPTFCNEIIKEVLSEVGPHKWKGKCIDNPKGGPAIVQVINRDDALESYYVRRNEHGLSSIQANLYRAAYELKFDPDGKMSSFQEIARMDEGGMESFARLDRSVKTGAQLEQDKRAQNVNQGIQDMFVSIREIQHCCDRDMHAEPQACAMYIQGWENGMNRGNIRGSGGSGAN